MCNEICTPQHKDNSAKTKLAYLFRVMKQMLSNEVKIQVLMKNPDMLHIIWKKRNINTLKEYMFISRKNDWPL